MIFANDRTSFNDGWKFIKGEKPNVLFIMSDDHSSAGVGAYNSRFARLNPTPTIDQLANEGLLFENCFVTNSICSPSRGSRE